FQRRILQGVARDHGVIMLPRHFLNSKYDGRIERIDDRRNNDRDHGTGFLLQLLAESVRNVVDLFRDASNFVLKFFAYRIIAVAENTRYRSRRYIGHRSDFVNGNRFLQLVSTSYSRSVMNPF